jgi:2-amino-4-hydroxy-6-hydroxymethyldihydropteridine diphosphokinase
MPHRVYVGLGSNLGDRDVAMDRAIQALGRTSGVQVVTRSLRYETDPVGPVKQGPFLNQVVEVQTDLSPQELHARTRAIEKDLGRVRAEKWGPRTIDIDLLAYDDITLDTPALKLPHPELLERAFVAVPLAEIAPDLVLPNGRAARGWADTLNKEGIRPWQRRQLVAASATSAGSLLRPLHPGDYVTRTVFAPFFHPTDVKALSVWFRSFAILLGAGMDVAEVADSMAHNTRNRTLRRVSEEITAAARVGGRISDILMRYPAAFPPFALALVRTGETSGLLEETFTRLSDYFEQEHELRLQYRWQTFYPKILFVVVVLLLPVISSPQIVLKGFGEYLGLVADLSLPIFVWGIALYMGWRILTQVPPLGYAVDRVKLTVPWFGSLVRRVATAKWARAFAMLVEAGLSMGEAMEVSATSTGNAPMARAIARQAGRLRRGESLSETMRAVGEFPDLAVQMAKTGERTGDIGEMLRKAAHLYEGETALSSRQLALVLGILIWAVIAGVIVFVVARFWLGYYGSLGL